VLAFVFWDKDGILLVDYLEKGANMATESCISRKTEAEYGLKTSKLSKRIFFLEDNASPHKAAITQQRIVVSRINFRCMYFHLKMVVRLKTCRD
jgi:hypothetical protein